MQKISLSYTLESSRDLASTAPLRNTMMDVLHAVREAGSISSAARELNLSYRHVWGQLKTWEKELGHELLIWERGHSAQLSPFGQRLLMAERMAQARLGPQIQTMRAELERAFAQAFDTSEAGANAEVLTLYASHDHALTLLQELAAGFSPEGPNIPAQDRVHLDIRFCGSVDAIRALNEGRCTVAGFHMQPFAESGSQSARTYRPLLKPGTHKIIGFARRTQGLIVPKGNPMRIRNLSDVARLQARFVNRATGTGTRLLLEELMEQASLSAIDIDGFDHVEASHASVAHAVASGAAEVALGTEYAAKAANLDFVPITEERYVLVCLKEALTSPPVERLLRILRSRSWANMLDALPGYGNDHSGQVAAMKRLLPWWK